jgi:chorismate mutase
MSNLVNTNYQSDSLSKIREQIDEINLKIVDLLHQRYQLTAKVARYKKQFNLPIKDLEREKLMFSKIKSTVSVLGLPVEEVIRIFEIIVEYTSKQQENILK